MAVIHNNAQSSFQPLAVWDRFVSWLGDFLVNIANANARVAEFEALNSKSDEDLEKMGLKREDIVRHVFRDYYYV